MHLTQTLKIPLQNLSKFQHQPSFVTLDSPSLFYAAPQTRCIPQITYPELEAKEPRAFHKRRQNSRSPSFFFINLFIYFSFWHHAKAIIDFTYQFACFHLVFCVSSVHLSPPHRMLLCSLQALPTLYSQVHTPYSHSHLIYPQLLSLN